MCIRDSVGTAVAVGTGVLVGTALGVGTAVLVDSGVGLRAIAVVAGVGVLVEATGTGELAGSAGGTRAVAGSTSGGGVGALFELLSLFEVALCPGSVVLEDSPRTDSSLAGAGSA